MKNRINLFKLLMFISIITNSIDSYSQDGSVRIITNPSTAIIRLDTILLKSNVPIKVKPGDYMLKIWAPKRRFYEQKLTIVPDSNIRIIKGLNFESEYIKYKQDRKRYRLKRFALRYIPAPIFIGLTVFNLKRQKKYSDETERYYNRAVDAQKGYNDAVYLDDIEDYRNSFTGNKEAYENSLSSLNQAKVITYGTIAVGAIVSWYFIKKSNKLVNPTYQPKTLLSNLNLNYQECNGFNSVILTYNF
ncbi:MAG: hypothetical protein COB15_12835 [Flavobacteriales bacterium]|nr:MAG: hypothetical protein COB15_12835 [Flavobacteriales bacterium]